MCEQKEEKKGEGKRNDACPLSQTTVARTPARKWGKNKDIHGTAGN